MGEVWGEVGGDASRAVLVTCIADYGTTRRQDSGTAGAGGADYRLTGRQDYWTAAFAVL